MQIFKLDINNIDDSLFEEWYNNASNSRKEKIDRLVNASDKKLSIAAYHLARQSVACVCGTDICSLKFGITESGKPYTKNIDIFFNISHSGSLVVCAVSEHEIGIDIQQIKPFSEKIIDRIAAETEKEYICKGGEIAFFEIWTLKEAYFKCIGTGLAGNIKDVTFFLSENNEIICSDKNVECSLIPIADGYICSVCELKQ